MRESCNFEPGNVAPEQQRSFKREWQPKMTKTDKHFLTVVIQAMHNSGRFADSCLRIVYAIVIFEFNVARGSP